MRRFLKRSLSLVYAMFVIMLLFMPWSNLCAQAYDGGLPPSFYADKLTDRGVSVDEVFIYPPDTQVLRSEDDLNGKNGTPMRIGVNRRVDAGMQNSGTWFELLDGSRLWILKIHSDNAQAINLAFDDFYLVPGSKLFFYNANKKQVVGAFTSNDNKVDNTFSTELIQGEDVYVEYYEPSRVLGSSRLNIASLGYVYRSTDLEIWYGDATRTVGASDACEVNINCSPVGDDWQDEKRGVAQITFLAGGSWYLCSGTLINNTNYDQTPYFLTAFHCGAADATAAELNQWQFNFNYESPDCANPGSEPATNTIIGCTRRAEGNINGGSDFFLLELNDVPTVDFNPYYNGWDYSGTASASGVGIHHPSGDIKKISTYGSISQSGSHNISGDIMAANSAWTVGWVSNANGWGVTEGGSSGSPLFRDNGLVIGTLTGGSSFCTNQTATDIYGRMEYHWNSNGGTSADQLEPWLNPTGSTDETLPGWDPFSAAPPTVEFTGTPRVVLEGGTVDYTDLSTNGPITSYSWTFSGGTPGTSSLQNPVVTYNTVGNYDVSLTANNTNGPSTETKVEYITVIDPATSYCDTIVNFCCTPSVYTSANGYVGGTNEYSCLEIAEYYENANPFNVVSGMRVYFAQVTNATNPNVTFTLWSDNAGTPDEVLAQTNMSLSAIEGAYTADGYIDVNFGSQVAFPGDGFYIGFSIPQTAASGDTIAVITNDDADSGDDTGYSLYGNSWDTYSAWGMSLQNMIFPFVCYEPNIAPIADFEGNPTLVNAGSTVAFTDLSYGGTPSSWSWSFESGTPTTSAVQNPVITYNTPGVYQVELTVLNGYGTSTETKTSYITVVDPNTCSCSDLGNVVGSYALYGATEGYLSGNNNYGDVEKGEYFENTTGASFLEGADFYFGTVYVNNPATNIVFNVYDDDGGVSGTHSYSPGTLLGTASVLISEIASDISSGDSTFVVFNPPIDVSGTNFFVTFEVPSPAGGGDSLAVVTGQQDAGTDFGWEQWNDNTWHSYKDAGWSGSFNNAIYPVVCSDGAPMPDFEADYQMVLAGDVVNFTDLSTCGATTWNWNFSGGTPATSTAQNPSVVYNTAGIYDVSLTSGNDNGSNPALKVDYITVLQPIVLWTFPNNPDDDLADGGIPANDGIKSISTVGATLDNYTTAGASTQSATASDWGTGANTKYWLVEFETTGYQNLTLYSKQSGESRSPQDFKVQYSLDNSTWTDVTGATVTIAQDWTTGVLSNISLPAACNNQATVYLRWIMSSNTGIGGNIIGGRESYIDDIYVIGEPANIPPIADFSANQTSVCEGASVTFTDLSTENPSSWDWTFTGGTPASSTVQHPVVTYTSAGTYEVSLTVMNAAGTDIETKTGYITVNANPSVSAFNTGDYCEGENIQLNATGSGGTDYSWSGPDGFTSSLEDPSITTATTLMDGVYTVVLTNTTSGCTAQASTTVVVNATPDITGVSNGPICEGENLLLDATSTMGGVNFSWTGPDGFTSSVEDPSITAATTAADGNYTVVVTDPVSGCNNSTTFYAFVNANPTVSASNTGAYCSGETIQLNATGFGATSYSWTGPDGFTNINEDPSIINSTTVMDGTYTVVLTNTTTGCTAQATTVVEINQTPNLTASNNAPLCEGENLILSATSSMGGLNYAWTGPDSYSSSVEDPTLASVTTLAGGTYNVVATDPVSGCSNTASTAATVNALPTVSATSNTPVCTGDAINLNATGAGGTSYSWSGPDGYTSTQEDPSIASATLLMDGVYTVSLENTTTGCIASNTTTVEINQTPDISASNNGPVCEGTDLTLNATSAMGGVNFSWTGPDAFSSALEDPVVTSATTTSSGTYTVVVTDPVSGCSNTANTAAVVNANPTVSASNTGAYCENETIQLNATGAGGASYSWTGPDGFTSSLEDPTIATATTAMSGTYTVSLENTATGCQSQATTDVIVNANPDITASNGGAYCDGDNIELFATSVSGDAFAWTGPNGFTSSLEDPVINAAGVAYDGSYQVEVTNTGTGCSAIAATIVTVNALPVITVSNDSPACAGEAVTLTATGSGGTSYSWIGPDGFTNNSQNPVLSNVQLVNAGTYTVELENTTTGCLNTATTDVVVNALPVITSVSNTGAYCEGENAQLNATVSGGDTFNWSGPDGFSSAVEDPSIANIQLANAGVYTLDYSNSISGCSAAAQTTTIVVNSNPVLTVGNTGAYCETETIQLEANTIAGATYSWSGPNAFSSSSEDPVIAGATMANAGTYTLNLTSLEGCTAQATTDVVVNANPTVNIGGNATQCSGTDLTLDAGAGFASYSWSNGATSQSITVNTADTYSVLVSTAAGCTATDAMDFAYYPQTTLSMSSTNETGAGNNDGTATATPTGVSPFGFLWDTGASSSTITGLTGGLYYVTVTDGNTCETEGFVNVATDNTPPVADFTADAMSICAGETVNFTDLTSNSPTSWTWTFGGGASGSSVQNPSVVFNTPGVYDVSLTAINADGSDSEIKTSYITVNSNPVISASNTGAYCENDAIMLDATGTGGDAYAWSGPAGFNSNIEDPSIALATLANAGTYTVVLTNTLTSCTSSVTTDVAVNANPTLSASNTGAYCEGEDISLSSTGSGGTFYSWTGPDAFTSAIANPSIASSTIAADGMYEVTLENTTTGCIATAQTTVVVNANPVLTASNTGDYCPGGTIEINATGSNGTSYEWSGPNGFSSFVEDPAIAGADALNAGLYSVTLTNSGTGCSAIAQTTVVVNANPDISASNGGAYCEGDNIELFATSATGDVFSWTGPNGFTSNDEDPVINAAGTLCDGTYQVEVINTATGCTNIANTVVTVNANPLVSASNTGAYCENETIMLNATGSNGTSYAWSGPDGFTSSIEDPSLALATLANAGTYTVVLTNTGTGCSAQANTLVEINANPVLTASNVGPYCEGELAQLSAAGSGGDVYTWTGPAAYTNTGADIDIVNVAIANAGTYTVELENTITGCVSAANTVLEVNALPTVSVSNDGAYCEGETITLSSVVSGGDTYVWSGPDGFTSSDANPVIAVSELLNDGVYTLDYSNSVTGCSVSANTTVVVYENPTVSVVNDGPACVGTDVNLTSTVTNATEYSWTGPDGFISADANPVLTSVGMLNAGTYEVTVTNATTGCYAISSSILLVNDNPVVELGTDIEVCDYVPVTLDAGAGFTYLWSTGEDTQQIAPTSSDMYSVVITDPVTGCTATDVVNVTFNESPALVMSSTDESGTGMNDGTATVAVSGGISPYTILWNTGGDTETITGLTGGTYSVDVEDQNGCVSSSSVVVNTLNSPPVAEFTADVVEGCDPVMVSFTDISTNNPVSWAWTFGDGNVSNEQNPDHLFTGAATYTVELTATNADGFDTYVMDIIVNENPVVDMGEDIDACVGTPVVLDAGTGFETYLWTGGEDTQTVEVSSDLTYQVTVSNVYGCTASDEIMVTFHELPVVDLGEDQTICQGEGVSFDAGAGFVDYDWNSGMYDTQTIEVYTTGNYAVLVTDALGCQAGDDVNVTVNALPELILPDTLACANELFSYTLTETYDEIFWSDGENDDTYSFTYTETGMDTVILTVGNAGCYTTDSLFVDVQICDFIDVISTADIQLYPNPTDGTLHVEISAYQGEVSVSLVNMHGQEIEIVEMLSDGEFTHIFDMQDLVPGVYLFRIKLGNNLHYCKVVKQ